MSEPIDTTNWIDAAHRATRTPGAATACPKCGGQALTAAWHLTALETHEAAVDLVCSACKAAHTVQLTLSEGALPFYPEERAARVIPLVEAQIEQAMSRVRRYAAEMPAAAFTTDPLWRKARWSATTFQWHPTNAAPPVMGLVFDDASAGKLLFQNYAKKINHTDRFEELRISIIEGAPAGQPEGYSVHLCPDQESLAAYATAQGEVLNPQTMLLLGQWNRMYPTQKSEPLLPRFKAEFEKHGEFLLAPVTRRPDGQLWASPELGIIKNTITFRSYADVASTDPDGVALLLPDLIRAR
jgi:hypothetical protein